MVSRLRWRLLAEVLFLLWLAFYDGLASSQGDDSLTNKDLSKSPSQVPDNVDVSECILLFAAFCNGNMGDVIQAASMRHLVARLAGREQCIWYAHPAKEDPANGFQEGEFFGDDFSRVISLKCDSDSGRQVSRFKGFIVGGGGLLEARHAPLDCPDFVEGLGADVPVAIFGVGASTEACHSAPLIQRAGYVSGRDEKSVAALAALLETMDHARVQPEEVRTVRDPVLSDNYYSDVDGSCWRKDTDARRQPLCFVLPSALKNDLQELHQIFSSEIVRPGDVLLNVFPKHQAEIEAYNYSVPVEKILDPPTFLRRLCGCRAVVSSRLHGVILALHAGVPTIAAWPAAEGNKVPGLMNDVLRFPDQFLLVDKSFTRKALDLRVAQVSIAYGVFGTQRLSEVFKRLDDIYRDTHEEGYRMLDGLLGLDLPDFIDTVDDSVAGEFWREKLYERDGEANVTTGSDAYRASAAKVSDTGQVSGGAGLSVTNAVEPAFNGEIVDVKRDGSLDKVQTGEGGKASAWTGAEVAPNTVEERPREEEVVSGIAEGAAEDEEKEKQTLAEKSWSKGAPPEAQSKEELPEATGEDRWEGAGSGTGTAKSADGNTAQEQKYSPGANVAVENSDSFFPNSPWTSSQGKEEIRQEPFPMAGHEGAFGGSWVCTLGALVLTALLGLPALSSLRKTEPYGNPVDRVPLVVEDGTVSTQTSPTAVLKISAPLRLHVPRLSGLVFFGVNYAIWVALAVGFNVCSRRYLHVTRNPVALLTIQGWVGIAVLWARNSLARCRRSSSRVASVSSTPSWAGRCGMRQVKSAGSKVWLAGLLHCCNAVLTSWLVLLGGIAVTHALKALEPIAAAAFSQWLLGSTLPPRRAAAVGVIVVGLGILTLPAHPPEWARGTQHPDFKEAAASVGDADIQLAISALITAGACCAVALRNVLLKGVNPPQPPPLALLVCSVVAAGVGSALLLLPWMPSSWESAGQPLLLASGVNASLCFVGYNLASFNLLSELSPVGHAVGNSSKGVCLFAAGLLLGKDRPISTRQLVGASAAFIGLASYNMAGVASSSSRKG